MTTTNTCKTCGCQDSFMVSPAPCPTPVGCPTPQPCSEIFDAQCVRYTGTALTCGLDVVVPSNDTVAEALESIVDYICAETVVSLDIECDTDIVVEQGTTVTDALVDIVDYFCNNTPAPDYTYEIGQYVASRGGVIFHRYKDGTTEYYLVVDIEDLTPTEFSLAAACPMANSSWNGLTNSTSISQSEAVNECLNSTNNSQTDWYLPAIDELNLLYNNRYNVSQGLITALGDQLLYAKYHSSTAFSLCNVLAFSFLDGSIDSTVILDSDVFNVRAVRKFSI